MGKLGAGERGKGLLAVRIDGGGGAGTPVKLMHTGPICLNTVGEGTFELGNALGKKRHQTTAVVVQ